MDSIPQGVHGDWTESWLVGPHLQQAQYSDGSVLREPGCLPPPVYEEANVTLSSVQTQLQFVATFSTGHFSSLWKGLPGPHSGDAYFLGSLPVSHESRARQPKLCSCTSHSRGNWVVEPGWYSESWWQWILVSEEGKVTMDGCHSVF